MCSMLSEFASFGRINIFRKIIVWTAFDIVPGECCVSSSGSSLIAVEQFFFLRSIKGATYTNPLRFQHIVYDSYQKKNISMV